MQDRIPTKPNRYAVYDDSHNFVRYEYHERADEPTQTGDALNKINILPDDVCAMLGVPTTAVPKDALTALLNLANTKAKVVAGTYKGTGTFGADNPTTVTVPFALKALIVTFASRVPMILICPSSAGMVHDSGKQSWNQTANVTWGANNVSWSYYDNASGQLNSSGTTYYYLAIGKE